MISDDVLNTFMIRTFFALCVLQLITVIIITSLNILYTFPDLGHKPTGEVCPFELFPEPSMLGNIPNFQFVLNKDICGRGPVDLLILVGSHPNNSEIRKVIRGTWGSPRRDRYVIKLLFLFGTPDDPYLQQLIINESIKYGDVVQGTFLDNYHNVTIRDLMGLRWTWRQCPQARFVMHMDDDASIYLEDILDELEEKMPKYTDFVACFEIIHGLKVQREGRYGLSKEEHPADIFDSYCPGWGYWFTPGAAKQLDKAALAHTPYWLNDAYLTGTLMTALGWPHLSLDLKWTDNPYDFVDYVNGSRIVPDYVLGYNALSAPLAYAIQEKFQQHSKRYGIPKNRPPRSPLKSYFLK